MSDPVVICAVGGHSYNPETHASCPECERVSATRTDMGDEGLLEWFGSDWGAPLCAENPQTATPVGRVCYRCNVAITQFDDGLIMDLPDFDVPEPHPPLGRCVVHIKCQTADYTDEEAIRYFLGR